jgi:hypothetical protein
MAPEWQTATETLLLAAGGRLPVMHARIAMLQALHRNEARKLLLLGGKGVVDWRL